MKRFKYFLIVPLLVFMSAQVSATSNDFYVGGGFGIANADLSSASSTKTANALCDEFVNTFGGLCGVSTKGNSSIGQIVAGWRATNYFGIEFAARKLGEYERELFAINTITGTLTEKENTIIEGLQLSAIGYFPASQHVSFLGKIGLFNWRQRIDYDAYDNGVLVDSANSTENGTSTSFGAGMDIAIKRFSIRIEAERFIDVGDKDKSWQADIEAVSVNFLYHF